MGINTTRAAAFTVIDRETNQLRDTGLTGGEVVDQHVKQGERSASLALLRYLRRGKTVTLGDIIVKRGSV